MSRRFQIETGNRDILAKAQMDRPQRTFADPKPFEPYVRATLELDAARTEPRSRQIRHATGFYWHIGIPPGIEPPHRVEHFRGVPVEPDPPYVHFRRNRALAGQSDVGASVSIYQRRQGHAFDACETGAHKRAVVVGISRKDETGAFFKMELHIATQMYGAGFPRAGWDYDSSAARRRAGIHALLDGLHCVCQ